MARTKGSGLGILGYEDEGISYTLHCFGNSTLGYFELPSYWNGHVAGPLLDTVPPNGPNLSYQNNDGNQLTATSPLGKAAHGVPGLFWAAILAVFGPGTFFDVVASSNNSTSEDRLACDTLRYPFTGLNFFGLNAKATAALTMATYAASNATLNVGPGMQAFPVWACAGSALQKLTPAPATMVAVTLLLAAQLAELAFLAIYASRRPGWTEALDAWAILRIGAETAPEVPAVSALEAQRVEMLDERKG
ncbi:hypothetical protein MMC13_007535 [Lambiella insularis]|nr:hypothetical protein [Lambiella insularis]